jgi:hypothetical protein
VAVKVDWELYFRDLVGARRKNNERFELSPSVMGQFWAGKEVVLAESVV